MPSSPVVEPGDLILQSRRVLTSTGERAATVTARRGRIVAIDPYDGPAGEDLADLAILPGVVDAHVHLNEPGRTEWEGFETGTAAAAAGGVTTLVDMPLNSSPVTTTAAALAAKRAAAEGKLHVDVGFYGGLVPGSQRNLAELLDAGVLGVKAFLCPSGIDEFPASSCRDLRQAMPLLAERGKPLLVHAELIQPTPPMSDPSCYMDYLASRPPEFEREAISLLIELCREAGCSTHIVHLADAGSLPMLQDARREGLPITVETCPHYLAFAAEEIPDGATLFKCAPPIRDASNREGLWRGLAEGTIDFISSDHSPCPPVMRRRNEGRFDFAWGGISSLQLALPIVWTEASARGHLLTDVAQWMCHRPAAFLGFGGGLQVGATANMIVLDPEARFIVREQDLRCRHAVSPYAGRILRGVVRRTYIHGQLASQGRGNVL
jgi:allantoinase